MCVFVCLEQLHLLMHVTSHLLCARAQGLHLQFVRGCVFGVRTGSFFCCVQVSLVVETERKRAAKKHAGGGHVGQGCLFCVAHLPPPPVASTSPHTLLHLPPQSPTTTTHHPSSPIFIPRVPCGVAKNRPSLVCPRSNPTPSCCLLCRHPHPFRVPKVPSQFALPSWKSRHTVPHSSVIEDDKYWSSALSQIDSLRFQYHYTS